MTVHLVTSLHRVGLRCWGCKQWFAVDADPVLSVDDNILEAIKKARKEGWVARRYEDEVFALCPSCVQADLARLLRPFYDQCGGSRSNPVPSSARGPDGAPAPSGLWRRILNLFSNIFKKEVNHDTD